MDYDLNQLESNLILARRIGEPIAIVRSLLRFLCSYNDNVVFSPGSVSGMLERTGLIARSTLYRTLEKLEPFPIWTEDTPESFILNPQFSGKGVVSLGKYKGPLLIYTPGESDLLHDLREKRRTLWARRGKDQIYKKKEDEMRALKNQMKQLVDQNKEMMEQHAEERRKQEERHASTMRLLHDILASCNQKDTKEKVERHLSLVNNAD